MRRHLDGVQRWPVAIITVLLLQVGFGVWMARTASSDPNFAIEPDYYNRAVNWDSTMAQSRRDKALGWKAVASLTRDTGRSAALRIVLIDAAGRPLVADSVQAEALAVAHAAMVHRLVLTPDLGGYAAQVPIAANGLWDVSVRATRGRDVFTAKLRTELR